MVVGVIVIMLVSIKSECAACPCAEQSAIFWRRSNNSRGAFTANMSVQANNAIRRAHDDMQFMANHQDGASSGLAYAFDLLIEGRRPTLIQPLRGLIKQQNTRVAQKSAR